MYELIYHSPQISGRCMHQKEQPGSSNIAILLGVFNKTIIPLALVGCEIVIGNWALRASLAIYHLISNTRSWNNC